MKTEYEEMQIATVFFFLFSYCYHFIIIIIIRHLLAKF